jgi:4-hydroxybenzoate polyprenyltransferase
MIGALLFFKAPIDLILIFTGITIAFGVYMLNKFTDDEDNYNCPDQKMFFQKKSILIALPILLIISSLILLLITNRLVPWHIILIACGILYSVSIIPFIRNKSLCFIRLKDIFFIKNISVSLLWGITPFALAASQKYSVMPSKFNLLVVAAAFCLTSLINTTSCDVRDVEGDRHAGILTIATRLGSKFTAIFLLCIVAIGCSLVEINYLIGNVSNAARILFFINIAWTLAVATPLYLNSLKLPK